MAWTWRDRLPPGLRHRLRHLLLLLRTRAPRTFNEKVRYKIQRDRRTLLVEMTDKVAARDFVRRHAPHCRLTTAYAVVSDANAIDLDRLPDEYVIKATHASGGVVIVTLDAEPGLATPRPEDGMQRWLIHPADIDWPLLRRTLDSWMTTTYRGPYGEWAYAHVPPRILVEELLRDERGRIPNDYKLWVFHGRVRVVEVTADRFGELAELLFTPDWVNIPDGPDDARLASHHQPPDHLGDMIEIAELLGHRTDFVRVDLFDCADGIYFGELTNYPGGGDDVRTAPVDDLLGSHWTVPRRYR